MRIFSLILILLTQMALMAQDTAYVHTYGGIEDDQLGDIIARDTSITCVGTTASFGNGQTDAYLFEVDTALNLLWSRSYGGNKVDWALDVDTTYDNGYLLAGYSNSHTHGDYDFYVVKTDSVGEMLWERRMGSDDWDFGYDVLALSDGAFVLGETYGFDARENDICLYRLDSLGETIWRKSYGGSKQDRANQIIRTPDNQFLILGSTTSYGVGQSDIYLIKIDSAGNELWSKTIGSEGYEEGYEIIVNNDNTYTIAGTTDGYVSVGTSSYLVKIDANGNYLWSNMHWIINPALNRETKNIGLTQTTDNNYHIIGYTKNFAPADRIKFNASRTNSAGYWQASAYFGGIGEDRGQRIIKTDSGPYYLLGTGNSWGSGRKDIIIIKINELVITPPELVTIHDSIPQFNAIKEASTIKKINCYPNPASDHVFFNTNESAVVSLFDLKGREVLRRRLTSSASLNVTSLNKGVYLYVVTTDEATHRGKLEIL